MANDAQTELWSGDTGKEWLNSEDRRMVGLAPFADLLMAVAQPAIGDRVLDVGCGTGPTTFALGDAVGPDGRVIGVDVSAPLLAAARSRIEGRDHVEFLLADAQTHAFDAVDLIASRFGVMFFDDPVAAFTNMARSLVPGGRVAFVCWQQPGPHNPMFVLPGMALSGIVELPPPPPPDAPSPVSFAQPDRVRSILESAGLHDVRLESHVAPMWMGPADPIDVAGGLIRMSRIRDVVAEVDAATRQRAVEAIAGALEPHTRDDGVWLDGAVWAVTARKS